MHKRHVCTLVVRKKKSLPTGRQATADRRKCPCGAQPSTFLTIPLRNRRGEKSCRKWQVLSQSVEVLIEKGYPQISGMDERKFLSHIEPLKEQLRELAEREFKEGNIPFVIVVRDTLASLDKKIPLTEVDGKKGFTQLDLSEIKIIDGVVIPDAPMYLTVDIETGKAMLNKTVDVCRQEFKKDARSGLTAEEGVALITQHPEILKDHNIDLAGSRLGSDGVPFLWLREGKPGLGWSGSGDRDARWGSASCGSRIGPRASGS